MSSLLYKRHSIIFGAAIDKFTGQYAPTGQIIYTVKRKYGTHSFTLSKLFSTADEAKTIALDEAIAWTDQHLAHSGA